MPYNTPLLFTFFATIVLTLTSANYAMNKKHTENRNSKIVRSYQEVIQKLADLELSDLIKVGTSTNDIAENIKLINSTVGIECTIYQEQNPHRAKNNNERKSNSFFLSKFYDERKSKQDAIFNTHFNDQEQINQIIAEKVQKQGDNSLKVYHALDSLNSYLLKVVEEEKELNLLLQQEENNYAATNISVDTMFTQAPEVQLFYLDTQRGSFHIEVALNQQNVTEIKIIDPTLVANQLAQNATISNVQWKSNTEKLWFMIKNHPYCSISLTAMIGIFGYLAIKQLRLKKS